jgi:hypothetical protein
MKQNIVIRERHKNSYSYLSYAASSNRKKRKYKNSVIKMTSAYMLSDLIIVGTRKTTKHP